MPSLSWNDISVHLNWVGRQRESRLSTALKRRADRQRFEDRVVLVDELDQMVTKKQDVIYNFFNWPHMPHSKLIVVAIANTMDLPERQLSAKIRSRLGSFLSHSPLASSTNLIRSMDDRSESYGFQSVQSCSTRSVVTSSIEWNRRRHRFECYRFSCEKGRHCCRRCSTSARHHEVRSCRSMMSRFRRQS